MKFYIIFSLITISFNIRATTQCQHMPARSKRVCFDFYKGVDSQGYHCCYSKEKFNGTGEYYYECFDLNQYEYDHIKETIKNIENDYYYKKGFDITIKSLDCNSYYLQLGIISFVFLLF